MGIPPIPGRLLLAFRIASFVFSLTSIALSAASVQLTKNVPRPATGDNILLIIASSFALVTTAFRIITHKSRNIQTKERMKRRFLPTITESVVVALLLAALIYGAVSSANGTGACQPNIPEEEEEGDGDDAGQGTTNVDVASGNRACALTKASTGMTAGNFVSLAGSLYSVIKQAYDESHV